MFEISPESKIAISILENNKYKAYLTGGCVRDLLMGLIPHDWDIATSALPSATLQIFKNSGYRTLDIGLKHGTVTVLIDKEPLEITTFRQESGYSDLRRPDSVEFVLSPEEDVRRRDFTMNAILYNPSSGLLDLAGGRSDIQKGIIRCVGDPDKRFSEDALRIMRAIRFSSTLGFEIEENTAKSLFKNKALLAGISAERKQEELSKLLLGKNVKQVLSIYREILEIVIPDICSIADFEQNNPHHCYNVWEHTVNAIDQSSPDLRIRLALLFHDIGKPQCCTTDSAGISHYFKHPEQSREIAVRDMTELKFSKAMIDTVATLIAWHDFRFPPESKGVKRLLNKIGEENFRLLLQVKKADILAQSPIYLEEKMGVLKKTENELKSVISGSQCFTLKNLAIGGSDLMAIGIPQSREMGRILNALLEMVINEDLPNTKAALIEAVKTRYAPPL